MNWNEIYKKYGEVEGQSVIIPDSFIKLLKQKKINKILDLACGTGRHSIHLAKQGFKVIAIDSSSEALKILERKIKEQSVRKNITIKQGLLSKIPLKDSSVDGIVCIKSLSHGRLPQIKKNISEMYRVVKPKGLVLTDLLSTNDSDFGKFKEVGPKTFLNTPIEEEVPHYYTDKKDVKELFSIFTSILIKEKKVKTSKFRPDKQFSLIYQIIASK